MTLLRDGVVEPDNYTDARAQEGLPPAGDIIVSLAQWQSKRRELIGRPGRLGIALESDEKPDHIAADLAHFDLVALDLPRFRDGRAFSHARLLRERLGFGGELRAVGDVLPEQLQFMHRVGFNSFEIESDDALRDWEIAATEISVWYQPTADGRQSVVQLRHADRDVGCAH